MAEAVATQHQHRADGVEHVRAVEQHLVGEVGRSVGIVIHARGYIIRCRRQQYGELTRLRVGLDGDVLLPVNAVLGAVGPSLAVHTVAGRFVEQRVGVALEGTFVLIQIHIHSAGILRSAAGEQRQRSSTDVGLALAETQGLLPLLGTADHAADDDGLRHICEGQVADAVVEVMHSRSGIATGIEEGVALLLHIQHVVANAHGYRELTVFIGLHQVAALVLHHHVIHTERAVLDRIGGVLEVNHTFHIEARFVVEVLRVEGQRCWRHIHCALRRVELVDTLCRDNRIGCASTHERNTADGVGALGVGHAEERELVGRGDRNVRAYAANELRIVVVLLLAGLGVVIHTGQGADALVEGPVSHQAVLRAAEEVVVVLLHVALQQLVVEETDVVNVALQRLRRIVLRGHAHEVVHLAHVERQLEDIGHQRVVGNLIQCRGAVVVVSQRQVGVLTYLDPMRRGLAGRAVADGERVAIGIIVVTQRQTQLAAHIQKTCACCKFGFRLHIHLSAELALEVTLAVGRNRPQHTTLAAVDLQRIEHL